MIGHEGKGNCTGKSDACRELPGKKIKHGDGESAEDKRDNTEVTFWFVEWIKLVGEDKEKGGWRKVGLSL